MSFRLIALGATLSTLAACGPRQAPTSALHGDSGVRVPHSSDEITSRAIAAIPATHRGWATDIVYGESEEGRNLHAIRLADPAQTATKAVLMTQAIHGNEFLDIANHLPAHFFNEPQFLRFLAEGGAVYVLPVVNADGFTAWQRYNSDGLDLNRDFPIKHYVDDPEIPTATESAENTAFAALLAERFQQKTPTDWSIPDADGAVEQWGKERGEKEDLRLFFDYHCCQGPTTGSLMPPWGDTPSLSDPDGIPSADVTVYLAYGDIYKTVFPNDFYGTGLEAIGYIAKGTGDEYAYEQYADHALTYEGRSGGIEPRRLQDHVRLWELLFARLH